MRSRRFIFIGEPKVRFTKIALRMLRALLYGLLVFNEENTSRARVCAATLSGCTLAQEVGCVLRLTMYLHAISFGISCSNDSNSRLLPLQKL